MPDLTDVVIIGGGVLGAALAWELSRRTVRVALLEAHALGGGTTGRSFAWINATAKHEDETYHRLNARGLACYDDLAAEWSAERIGLHGGGSLFWAGGADEAGRERLRQRAVRLQGWGYPVALLNAAEMQTLEPQANFASPEREGAEGLFAPADKWLETPRLIRFFTEQTRERNGDIREYCPATGFTRGLIMAISTVETPEGRIATGRLVLTAGAQTPALLAQITGNPTDAARFAVRPVPGLLVETPPGSAPEQAQRVLYPPDAGGLHLRPTPGGGLLLGADDADALISESREVRGDTHPAASTLRESAPREANFVFPPEVPAALLRRAAQALPNLPVEALMGSLAARVCVRPVPADGLPIVGEIPGLKGVYMAVTHSGITLGPLLARLLAEEMVIGRPSPLLAPYRPERFLRESR
ncbi:MAG TPA: FAD-binding oxidoreductase [Chthonomonadaceae bacterium]|nr:FAD-binding oxidoreductase [Chthonomonadaceae bacterium]